MMSRSDGQAECGLSPMCGGEPERASEQGIGLISPILYDNNDDVSDISKDGADDGEI